MPLLSWCARRAISLVPVRSPRRRADRSPRRLTAVLFGLTVAASGMSACGGGGDGGGTAPPSAAALVDLSSSTLSFVAMGASQTVTVTVRDATGKTITGAAVTWTSSNPTIAEVAPSGNGATASVIARAPGVTTIRATSGSASSELEVKVNGVRAISVAPSAAAIKTGETQQLTPTLSLDPGVSNAVRYTSDSPLIATVSAAGLVTGVTPGVANIRVVAIADERFAASAQFTIAPYRGVAVAPAVLSMGQGETRALSAAVSIDNGRPTTVTWRTSAAGVATVSAAGVVTGVALGTATITAVSVADTTLRASATVNIVPVVRSVALSAAPTPFHIGSSTQFTATVVADAGALRDLVWRTSDPSVASVTSTGIVNGVALGTTTISAISVSDTTKRATVTLNVTPRPLTVQIAQRAPVLGPGGTLQLSATVQADPGVATGLSWSSSNGSVITVSNTGFLTAVGVGSSIVSATSTADATKRDTVTVTVMPRLGSIWTASRLGGDLFEDVLSIQTFENNIAYCVNLIGDVFRYDGTRWVNVLTGGSQGTQFTALHGSSSSNIVAVGTNGVIVRFNGTSWSKLVSPTTKTLTGVYMESLNSGFAVGADGVALRYTATGWAATQTGTTARLNGVWMQGGNAFAVGDNGTMLRYFSGAWSVATPVTGEDLYAIAGFSSANLLAVGSFGTMVKYDGNTWSLVTGSGSSADLFAVAAAPVAAGGFTVAGDGVLLKVTGSTITRLDMPYAARLTSAAVDALGNPWVGGQRGMVIRWGSNRWDTQNLAPDLIDVWATAPNNAWAVGEFGFIYRYNGALWARQSTPTTATINTVWGASAMEGFAGGDNGVMLRFDGTSWTSMSFPSTASVFAMWGSAANNVYAVTSAGEVVRYNGTAWQVQTNLGRPLWAIHGTSDRDIYVSGEGGSVYRFGGGTTWTALPAGATGTLAGIWFDAANNLFTVGADGTGTSGVAYGFNGTAWRTLPVSTTRVLTSVWGPSSVDVFATGDQGTLLRYNGTSWSSINTRTGDLLWSISGAPSAAGGGFAVGYNSVIITGSNSATIAAAIMNPDRTDLDPTPAASADRRGRHPQPEGPARRNRKSGRPGPSAPPPSRKFGR